MKSFFEEYGFVILAAIVVILLIAMATPIGDLVKIQVSEVVNSFGSKTQSKLNAADGIIQVRVSTANNKITLEWDANKKEDVFKYQYKASNTKGEANWTPKTDIPTGSDKTRKVEITKDSNDQPLANKTKVEYKIYDSNDQLVASGVVTAKVGKGATTGGEGGTGGGSTETTPTETLETGTKLTIEGKEYTVIEQVEGNKYKVLTSDITSPQPFADKDFSYKLSKIASYLDNEYYDSLPKKIQDAIVETSIQQNAWCDLCISSDHFKNDCRRTIDAGTHKVFVPSWDEVSKAFGSTKEGAKKYNFNRDYNVWLRDAYDSSEVLFARRKESEGGELGYLSIKYTKASARPAFVIDLSMVDYKTK